MVTKKMQDIAAHMNLGAISEATADARNRVPQTPVGKVMKDVVDIQQKQKVIDELTEKLEAAGNGELVRMLDPSLVFPGARANRMEQSFKGKEFNELKEDIAHAGGNITPIKVRPIQEGKFEIIFGHRRHRSCLELGLPVLAMIVDMDDQQAFIEMVRENNAHANLRPIEVGRMYMNALDTGLFPSMRKLSEKVGMDHSNLAKAIALARLPEKVLLAFVNLLELQYVDAIVLNSEVQKNPDVLMDRANRILVMNPRPGYREVLKLLTQSDINQSTGPTRYQLKGSSTQTAKVSIDPFKKTCKIEISNATPSLLEHINKSIQDMIGNEQSPN